MNRYLSLGTTSLVSMVLVASCAGGKDGIEGKTSLVRLDSEAAGANCANGGTAIKSGFDANGDGQLSDDEVIASNTHYFCSGAKGATGNDYEAKKALTHATPVLPGEKCERGGYLLQTGVDDNDNGQLDDGEIDSSQYVCAQNSLDEIHFGSIAVRSTEDLQQLDGVKILIGDLQILDGAAEEISLPDLRVVSGQAIFGDFSGPGPTPTPGAIHIKKLDLPALQTAANAFIVVLPELTSFSAPVLENAYGPFGFIYTKLTQVTLPKLTTSAMLAFQGNNVLADVQAPELSGHVGTIQVYGGTAELTLSVPKVQILESFELQSSTLKDFTLPEVEYLGSLRLVGNAALTGIHLPKLISLENVEVNDNDTLTALDFPAPTSMNSFKLTGNAVLTAVHLQGLTSISSVEISSNDVFTTLDLPALKSMSSFKLTSNAALTEVHFPNITSTNSVEINNNDAFTTLDFPALQSMNGFKLIGNASLAAVHLPSLLSTDNVEITDNGILATLDLPALQYIRGSAGTNPLLSECVIVGLNAQAFTAGQTQFLSDNGGNKADQCDPAKVCPFFTVGGVSNRYRQCLSARTFTDARSFCQGLATGTELVVFEDFNEWSNFSAVASGGRVLTGSWIGYTDAAVEGSWKWVSGVTGYQPGSSYQFWNFGEPNNSGNEDCAQVVTGGKVNDIPCTSKNAFVCEANPVAPPP